MPSYTLTASRRFLNNFALIASDVLRRIFFRVLHAKRAWNYVKLLLVAKQSNSQTNENKAHIKRILIQLAASVLK